MLGQWFSCFTRVFSVLICHILESMLHLIHFFTFSSFTAPAMVWLLVPKSKSPAEEFALARTESTNRFHPKVDRLILQVKADFYLFIFLSFFDQQVSKNLTMIMK